MLCFLLPTHHRTANSGCATHFPTSLTASAQLLSPEFDRVPRASLCPARTRALAQRPIPAPPGAPYRVHNSPDLRSWPSEIRLSCLPRTLGAQLPEILRAASPRSPLHPQRGRARLTELAAAQQSLPASGFRCWFAHQEEGERAALLPLEPLARNRPCQFAPLPSPLPYSNSNPELELPQGQP